MVQSATENMKNYNNDFHQTHSAIEAMNILRRPFLAANHLTRS